MQTVSANESVASTTVGISAPVKIILYGSNGFPRLSVTGSSHGENESSIVDWIYPAYVVLNGNTVIQSLSRPPVCTDPSVHHDPSYNEVYGDGVDRDIIDKRFCNYYSPISNSGYLPRWFQIQQTIVFLKSKCTPDVSLANKEEKYSSNGNRQTWYLANARGVWLPDSYKDKAPASDCAMINNGNISPSQIEVHAFVGKPIREVIVH